MIRVSILVGVILSFSLYGDSGNIISNLIDGNLSKVTQKVSKKIGEVIGDGGNSKQNREESFEEVYKKEVTAVWEDVIEKLQDGINLENEKDTLPEEAIFSKDKKSVQSDINEIFSDILELILEGDLFKYRENLEKLESRIDELEKKILIYREKRVIAPKTSIMATTRDGYNKKISDAKKEIENAKRGIEEIKKRLNENLKFVGINLTTEQIDVLLSRVDGDDIIKMTITMKVLKDITYQLSEIMRESSNNLKYAKKYYGMYMVLAEMIAWIQHEMIKKYNSEYIPYIDKIIKTSSDMIEKTKKAISQEKEPSRIESYKQNLTTQQYTKKIAERYKRDLLEKLKQLQNSYIITLKDVNLAKNTYKTVSLSDELFRLITNSQKVIDTVMKLQIPSIVPFDSELVKNKYRELTREIRGIKK